MEGLRLQRYLLGTLLVALLLGAAAGFETLDALGSGFFRSGAFLLVYHFLELLFLVLFGLVCLSWGLTLFGLKQADAADRYLVACFSGWAALATAGYLLGLADMLVLPFGLLLLGTGLFILPHMVEPDEITDLLGRIPGRLLAAVGVLLLLFFCLRGLPPDVRGDFSGFFQYYDHVLASTGLRPEIFYSVYFEAKGSGAAHLAATLSDARVMQSVNVWAVFLILWVALRLIGRIPGVHPLVGPAAAAACMGFGLAGAEMYTPRIQAAAWPVFMVYAASLQMGKDFQEVGRLRRSVIPCIAAAIIQTPLALLFVLPFWLWEALALGRPRPDAVNNAEARDSAWLYAAVACTACIGVLLQNKFMSGVFEAAPIWLWGIPAGMERIGEWIDPVALLLHISEMNGLEGFSFSAEEAVLLVVVVSSAAAAALRLHQLDSVRLKELRALFRPVMSALLIGYIVVRFMPGIPVLDSGLLLAALGGIAVAGFIVWLEIPLSDAARRLGGSMTREQATEALCIVLIGLSVLGTGYTLVRISKMHGRDGLLKQVRFCLGNRSNAAMLGPHLEEEAVVVDGMLGPGDRVLPLNPQPGWYVLPSGRFLDPLRSDLGTDLEQMLYGAAKEAESAYLRHDIRRFTLNMSRPPVVHVYSDLFSPRTLGAFFRVKRISHRVWLLSPGDSPEDGNRPDGDFMKQYRDYYERAETDDDFSRAGRRYTAVSTTVGN